MNRFLSALAALVFALAPTSGRAAPALIEIAALRITPPAAWTRAAAELEQAEGAIILNLARNPPGRPKGFLAPTGGDSTRRGASGAVPAIDPPGRPKGFLAPSGGDSTRGGASGAELMQADGGGAALQLLIPTEAVPLRASAKDFYKQIERKWSGQYGKAAAIGWIDAPDGARWLACRRPSNAGEGVVFHLVREHEGLAYSLLLLAPDGVQVLPAPARELLAAVRFEAPPALDAVRVYLTHPRAGALNALMEAEAAALDADTALTGYRLEPQLQDARQARLAWRFEGSRWREVVKGGTTRQENLAFETGGEVRIDVGLEAGPGGGESGGGSNVARHTVSLSAELLPGSPPLRLHLTRHATCAPAAALRQALRVLGEGARQPLKRLQADKTCGKAARALPPPAEEILELTPGQPLKHRWTPPAAETSAKFTAEWLEVAWQPAPGLGHSVLERIAAVVVYARGP